MKKKYIIEVEEITDLITLRPKGWYEMNGMLYVNQYDNLMPTYIANRNLASLDEFNPVATMSEDFVLKALAVATSTESHKFLFQDKF